MKVEINFLSRTIEFDVDPETSIFFRDSENVEHGPFWALFSSNQWESDTLRMIDQCLLPESTFIDVGAWIGPFALLAGAIGCKVICFEPDPTARDRLRRNVARNAMQARIEIDERAVALREGKSRLFFTELGDSESSVLQGRIRNGTVATVSQSLEVDTVTTSELSKMVSGESVCLIKVDIEGAEYELFEDLILFAEQTGAALIVALHPENVFAGSFNAEEFAEKSFKQLTKLRGYTIELKISGVWLPAVEASSLDRASLQVQQWSGLFLRPQVL